MKRRALLLCLFGVISSCLNTVSGRPDSAREPKIIGGRGARPNQFPYLVSVYHTNRRHNCMGGILNDRYILTAAHCIVNPATYYFFNIPMEIVVDTVDLVHDTGIRIEIEKGYVLKDYAEAGDYNDIGILKLSKSLDLANNPQRQKLDLPKVGVDYVGRDGAIAGFGYTDPNKSSTRGKHLMNWRAEVISNEECQKKWQPDSTRNYLCAEMLPRRDGSAAGICNGDSGSPLVIGNTAVGVAIVADDDCDERWKPALYSQVSLYLPFIQKVLSGQINNQIVEYNFPSP